MTLVGEKSQQTNNSDTAQEGPPPLPARPADFAFQTLPTLLSSPGLLPQSGLSFTPWKGLLLSVHASPCSKPHPSSLPDLSSALRVKAIPPSLA